LSQSHSKTRLRTLLASLIAMCVLAGAPTLALSADDGDDGPTGATIVPTRAPKEKRESLVRNKFFYKRGRVEIAPRFGYVVNNALNQEATFGLGVTYHFSERLGLEIAGDFAPLGGTANTKSLTKAVLRVLNDDSFRLESVDPLAFVTASLVWYPMYGKLTPFSSFVVNLDFFFLFGLGWSMEHIEMVGMQNPQSPNEVITLGLQPAQTNHLFIANFGFGAKWYLTRWLSFRIDGRLYVSWDEVINFDEDEAAEHNRGLGANTNRLDCHGADEAGPICKVTFPTTWLVSGTLGFWAPGDKAARRSAGERGR
jgi:outer membrane beta-barrel protein